MSMTKIFTKKLEILLGRVVRQCSLLDTVCGRQQETMRVTPQKWRFQYYDAAMYNSEGRDDADHVGPIRGLAHDPINHMLTSCSNNGTVKVRGGHFGQIITTFGQLKTITHRSLTLLRLTT